MLESNVIMSRDKATAHSFMKETLKHHYSPAAITTDGLRSYGTAVNELGCRDRPGLGRCPTIRLEIAICRSTTVACRAPIATNEDAANIRCRPSQRPVSR